MKLFYIYLSCTIISIILILAILTKPKNQRGKNLCPNYKVAIIEHKNSYTLLTDSFAYDELSKKELDSLLAIELR